MMNHRTRIFRKEGWNYYALVSRDSSGDVVEVLLVGSSPDDVLLAACGTDALRRFYGVETTLFIVPVSREIARLSVERVPIRGPLVVDRGVLNLDHSNSNTFSSIGVGRKPLPEWKPPLVTDWVFPVEDGQAIRMAEMAARSRVEVRTGPEGRLIGHMMTMPEGWMSFKVVRLPVLQKPPLETASMNVVDASVCNYRFIGPAFDGVIWCLVINYLLEGYMDRVAGFMSIKNSPAREDNFDLHHPAFTWDVK